MSKAAPRRTNVPMILMIFAVVMFGLIILYSVSGPAGYAKPAEERSSMFYVGRQIVFTVFGLILMLIINFFPVNGEVTYYKYHQEQVYLDGILCTLDGRRIKRYRFR